MKKLPILLSLLGLAAINFTQKTQAISLANDIIPGIAGISIAALLQNPNKKVRKTAQKIGLGVLTLGAVVVMYDRMTH